MITNKDARTSGIIVAAGSGRRMGGVSKPMIKIGGRTLYEHVLSAFLGSAVNEIIVVCPDDGASLRAVTPETEKPVRFVRGGETRQDSVYLGVAATSSDTRLVCVHDCARPFVTAEMIDAVISGADAEGYGAATACTPVTDTVRYVDEERHEFYTPDRKHLKAIQTPQCFDKKKYVSAFAYARSQKQSFTDDCGLLEWAGTRVNYIDCPKSNIKLTTAYDVTLARAINKITEIERGKE